MGEEVNLDGGVTARVEDLQVGITSVRQADSEQGDKRTWRAWTLVIDMVEGGMNVEDGGVGGGLLKSLPR